MYFHLLVTDDQKPSFRETCPSEEKTVFNDRGKTTATVYWGLVEATDNSGNVNLEVSPNVSPPHVFRLGRHTVTYTARDDSGNEAFCHLKFNVQGKDFMLFNNLIEYRGKQNSHKYNSNYNDENDSS